jgi:hypothetical protein
LPNLAQLSNADAQINELLTIKKSLESKNKMDGGYTIQLFYGDREMANTTLKKYRNTYGTWPASIEYETPNYKVWVGNFATRIQADRALVEIKRGFSGAFILEKK